MRSVFFDVLEINIAVAIILVLLLPFLGRFRKRYGARWMKYIWILFAFRLLIPYNFSLPTTDIRFFNVPGFEQKDSVSQEIQENEQQVIQHYNENDNKTNLVDVVDEEPMLSNNVSESKPDIQQNQVNTQVSGALEHTLDQPMGQADGESDTEVSKNAQSVYRHSLASIMAFIWIIVAGINIVLLLVKYSFFLIKIKREITNAAIQTRIEKLDGANWKISVCENSKIKSPMLFGVFRTKLIIPASMYEWDRDVQDMVLLHELAHLYSKDLLLKAVMNFACCMNWFNPLVYYLRKQFFYDMELACDEMALSLKTKEEKAKYAKALLMLAKGKHSDTAFTTGFGESKKSIKGRIDYLFHGSKRKRGIIGISVIVMVFMGATMLISCGYKPEEKENEQIVSKDSQSTEKPDEESVSIEFMGERITAPASYPDVPAAYKPVLDDLYLYGELLYRYETLNKEGKVTNDMMKECDGIQEEIEKRGYISNPEGATTGTSGYALADLDGDNSPELLLLDQNSNPSVPKQNPIICSVFTIRDGKPVTIENNSDQLKYETCLSADGTFYQKTGLLEDTTLRSFRLEANSKEFTTLSECSSKLSFSEGDVPVSYWVKKEDGKEISISEEEFNTLLEKYNDTSNRMALNFVPVHPGAKNLYAGTSATEDAVKVAIEYPTSYQDAPIEYKPILDELYYVNNFIRRGESMDVVREEAAKTELGIYEDLDEEFGYAVTDLNNDGTKELVLGSVEELNKATPTSVYTLNSGEAVLLQNFWSRSRGVIAADGTIYGSGSGGAAYTYLSSYQLKKNADALTQLTNICSDYSDQADKPFYYQIVNEKYIYITQKEFRDYQDKYENPKNIMKLKVHPIAD